MAIAVYGTSDSMKRKGVILVIALVAVAIVIKVFLTGPAPDPPRPITVSFIGFSNALPFLGALEEVRSLQAVFQVTNHTATRMAYHSEAQASRVEGKRSSMTRASYELSGNGTGTFMVSTAYGTNGWTFLVVSSSSRPRPVWQQRLREYSKWLGTPPIFVGPARTSPQFTNVWTTPP